MAKPTGSDNDVLMYVLFAVIGLFIGYIAYTAFMSQKCEGGVCHVPAVEAMTDSAAAAGAAAAPATSSV